MTRTCFRYPAARAVAFTAWAALAMLAAATAGVQAPQNPWPLGGYNP